MIVLVGLEPLRRPPDHVGAHLPQPATIPRSSSSTPGAPRRRWPPPSTWRARPKSDLTLLYGLAHLLIERGAVDQRVRRRRTPTASTSFAAHVEPLHRRAGRRPRPGCAGRAARAARRARSPPGKAVSFWWTMGVNQSHQGVRTAQAIIDLALMTGNIGRPGTGANSITGQCNAMGSRLFSNTTSLLGGRDFADAGAPGTRSPTSSDIDVERIPDRARAWPTTRSSRASSAATIKAPVGHRHQRRPLVDQPVEHARAARPARLPGRAGHVRRPPRPRSSPTSCCPPPAGARRRAPSSTPSGGSASSSGWRRAPGEALADFYIFQAIADAWGCGDLFRRWTDPEAAFEILQELTRGPALRHHGGAGLRARRHRRACSGR